MQPFLRVEQVVLVTIPFESAFPALTGHRALHWQRRLFGQLLLGEIPSLCDLPTGLGKTSVIPIWAIALAQQILCGSVTLPRRLVYIVNRRTVVLEACRRVHFSVPLTPHGPQGSARPRVGASTACGPRFIAPPHPRPIQRANGNKAPALRGGRALPGGTCRALFRA